MRRHQAPGRRPRLLIAVTDSISCVLIRGQLAFARDQGFDVGLVCSPGPLAEAAARREGATLLPVPMRRRMTPVRDLAALARLCLALKRFRPDVVNAGTPKAGLLVTLAAWLCRVPCRIYTMRGLVLETSTGPLRLLLHIVERLTCRLADRVVCISPSLRVRALELGMVPRRKAVVLGSGSSNGIDVDRFRRTDAVRDEGHRLRAELGIPEGAVVVGFVGRLVRDKGVTELTHAWAALSRECPAARLVVAGAFEGDVPADVRELLERDPSVRLIGHVDDPTVCYAAMDLLVLPSYREGFGNVLLEAAAMELPVVATRITGCVDAVDNGVTGTLVPVRDVGALTEAIRRYVNTPDLRARHGRAGRARVVRQFASVTIWKALHAHYVELLRGSDRPLPAPDSAGATGEDAPAFSLEQDAPAGGL